MVRADAAMPLLPKAAESWDRVFVFVTMSIRSKERAGAWPRIRINLGNKAKGSGPIPAAARADHYAIRGFSDLRPRRGLIRKAETGTDGKC